MEQKEKYFAFLIYSDIRTILTDNDMAYSVDSYYKYVLTTIPCVKID
jgi:hypothetical protein